jgi:hypothetical protein
MANNKTSNLDLALKLKARGSASAAVVAAGPVPVKVMAQEVVVKTEVASKHVEVANRTEVEGRFEG